MRLYRTSFVEPAGDEGKTIVCCNWQGSLADAATARREAKSEGYEDVKTEEVDVPTQKAPLLDFLNENATIIPDEDSAEDDEGEAR
jgi:hypothetical protein